MIAQARHVHLLVRIGALAVCGLLFSLGVFSFQTIDRQLPPGTDALVQIKQVGTSESQAIATMADVTAQLRLNMLRVGANPEGPAAAPWYFAFVGDKALFESTFPGNVYPSFSPATSPRVFPGRELSARDQPVRGTYAVQGSSSDGQRALIDRLAAGGLKAESSSVDPMRNYFAGLLASSSWPALVAAVLALVLTVVYSVVASRRSVALQQFDGYHPFRLVGGQAIGVAANYVGAMAVVSALGTAGLVLYNGLNQYWAFIGWALVPIAVVGVIALVVQLVASVLALRLPAYAAVKGARPRRLLAAAAVVTEVLMVALVYAATAQSLSGLRTYVSDARSFSIWESERSAVTVQINPNAFESPGAAKLAPDIETAYEDFGKIFAALDRDGSAVLSFHESGPDAGSATIPPSSYGPLGSNALIVNNNYLDRHAVLAAGGMRLQSLEPRPRLIHLLIPENQRARTDELKQAWAQSTVAASDPYQGSKRTDPYEIAVHYTQAGQEIFNYGDTWRMERWTQQDPVIAVVSPQTAYFSHYNLLGVAANGGGVVFADSGAFKGLAKAAGLTERFSSISSPATQAAQLLRDRETRLLVAAGNAVLGAVALICAIALLSAIYADSSRYASFLRRTHGWSTWRIHAPFISGISAVGVGAVTAAALLMQPAGYTDPFQSSALAAAIILLVVTTLTVATAAFDRRACAELITQR